MCAVTLPDAAREEISSPLILTWRTAFWTGPKRKHVSLRARLLRWKTAMHTNSWQDGGVPVRPGDWCWSSFSYTLRMHTSLLSGPCLPPSCLWLSCPSQHHPMGTRPRCMLWCGRPEHWVQTGIFGKGSVPHSQALWAARNSLVPGPSVAAVDWELGSYKGK